jgi:type IV pilus assembly protein PilV
MSNTVRTNRPLNRKRTAGLTLVEILVTLLVTSIGLLGVAGLHAMSLRNNYDALMRSHASALAADIIDRMRANSAAVTEGGDYDDAELGADIALGEDPTQAAIDVNEWKTTLKTQLPDGDGAIAVDDATDIVTIEVQWGERDTIMTFKTETEI